MDKFTQKEEPLVSVVVAVYKPDIKWLEEQLLSLNAQTYKNIELLIWDDCPEAPVDEEVYKRNLPDLPYKLFLSEKNLGSTKVFEKLTVEAGGKYISYCDQDDVWEMDKVFKMVNCLENGNAALCYCDLSVIDARGNKIYDSFTEVSKRQRFIGGENLFKYLMVRNVVVGCAMMIRAEIAKEAIPFGEGFVHDHWLALYASKDGTLEPIYEQLIKYRIHGNNQTGVLKGIESKEDYFRNRIEKFKLCAENVYDRFGNDEKVGKITYDNMKWANARFDYYKKFSFKALKEIWKNREFGRDVALFEIVMKFMPDLIFRKAAFIIKKGKI